MALVTPSEEAKLIIYYYKFMVAQFIIQRQ
jgi:hypothetical protein